jgi:molybdopterin-containing oxidoreductase family membrane subunit
VSATTAPARAAAEPLAGRGPLLVWVGLLLAIMAVGFGAFLYQFFTGLIVTGLRNTFMWGHYILFFMFFIGLSAGGLIVASAGRLFGITAFKPITRLAVLTAAVSVMLAAVFIVPDLGRPERILAIFLDPNLTSPMIWDIAIVTVYMGLSCFYVWLYARADFARRGSWLALGTGTSEQAMAREERVKTVMAWVALPSAIMLHSITAWIFGLMIGRTSWYSSIMAPMFIGSALVSGTGLLILLALALRRLGRLRFGDDLVALLGGMLAVFIAVVGFLILAEYLTATYPGGPEGASAARLLVGPYAPLFWFEVVVGLVLPFGILAVRRLRRDPRWVAAASGLAILGIFIHRLNLLLNGLSYPTIQLPPGLPIGTDQGGGVAFAVSHWYVPTLVEWLIVGGVLAFGGLVFTLSVLILPLQEPAEGTAEGRARH